MGYSTCTMKVPVPMPMVHSRNRNRTHDRDRTRPRVRPSQALPHPTHYSLQSDDDPARSQTPPPPYEPYASTDNGTGNLQVQQRQARSHYVPRDYRHGIAAPPSGFAHPGPAWHPEVHWHHNGDNDNDNDYNDPRMYGQYSLQTNTECPITRSMNQSAAFCDLIAARLNEAVCRVDGEHGRDEELEPYLRQLNWGDDEVEEAKIVQDRTATARSASRRLATSNRAQGQKPAGKSSLYANSRLPPHLPPLKVYTPTWRLLCEAARASQDVYVRPRRGEREEYVEADWRQGTKAMVVKSSPMDDQDLIVFAIRGSQWNAVDWLVNLRPAPTTPAGFLDDAGNACHAGFLAVARAMVAPVAARLRHLLQQQPSRAASSLLITGHSAGGAVAALLFMHMLATSVESELTVLTGCFKRVHCVTFGAPPVSLLPLQKPPGKRFEKSVFLSFINEGDLVTRFADKAYLTSLAKLLAAPAPKRLQTLPSPNASSTLHLPKPPVQSASPSSLVKKISKQRLKNSSSNPPPLPSRAVVPASRPVPAPTSLPRWPVPPATLSNAGRLVVLRDKNVAPLQSDHVCFVEAVVTSDQQLREVVFGDIASHAMSLYKKRIDELAIAAVVGR